MTQKDRLDRRAEDNGNQVTIAVNDKAFQRLAWAKKDGENYSDVIIRLTSTKLQGLQRRGEKEINTSDKRKLSLSIDRGKCLGAESCVALAPLAFALDETNLGFGGSDQEPLGMRDVMDKEVDSETIIRAAYSCPYKAIYVKDVEKRLRSKLFPEHSSVRFRRLFVFY